MTGEAMRLCAVLTAVAAVWGSVQVAEAASAERGLTFARLNCARCHSIPGIHEASGLVGPPLDAIARQAYVAGILPNTPANLARWIAEPQSVKPGTAMPNTGISKDEARDIAAFLSSR